MTITRRTLVTTGAWTAPAVLTASAAPALAASTAGYDLGLFSASGGTTRWYNSERTHYNTADWGNFALENNGPEASPASGVTFTFSYDQRLFGEVSSDNSALLGQPAITTQGNLVTAVFPVLVAIAPGDRQYVQLRTTTSPEPEQTEVRSDYEPTTWLINTPGGDTDASNDIVVDEIEYIEVEPWNGAITGTFDTVRVECSDGAADISYPTTITVTSDGPNPIPAGTSAYFNVNGSYTDDENVTRWGDYFETFRLESATLGGEPFTPETQRNSAGLDSAWILTEPLPAGSVLELTLSATGRATTTDPVPDANYGGLSTDGSETSFEDNSLTAPAPVRV